MSNLLIFIGLVLLGFLIPPPFTFAARVIVVILLTAWRLPAGIVAALIYAAADVLSAA